MSLSHKKVANQGSAGRVYTQPTRTSKSGPMVKQSPVGPPRITTSITKPGSGTGGTGTWGRPSLGKGTR